MVWLARKRLELVIGLVLLGSLCLISAFGVVTYQNLKEYHFAQQRTNIITEQLRSLNVMLSTLQDAEIGQRGFLLTGDQSYLEPYTHALSSFPYNLAWLMRSFASESAYASDTKRFQQLSEFKLAELNETLRLANENRLDAAIMVVRSNKGKNTMDQIRSIVSSIQSAKRDELRRIQGASAQRLHDGRTGVLQFGTTVGLTLLAIYGYLLYDLGDRRRLQSAGRTKRSLDISTGAHSPEYLQRALNNSLKHADRDRTLVALMLINIKPSSALRGNRHSNNFINVAAAKELANVTKMQHVIARLDDGVFAFLLPSFSDRKALGALARQICDKVTLELIQHLPDRRIDIDVGVSVYPDDASTAGALMDNARMLSRNPPPDRRGRYHFSRNSEAEPLPRDELVAQGLHEAVATSNFKVVYQPQVNLHSNEIYGAEALIRWEHPTLGHVSPDEFIPVAERTGLILPIGLIVLNVACREAAKWAAAGAPIKIAVNVCALQLHDPEFFAATEAILKECGLPPSLLEIELTERVMMDANIAVLLHKFKKVGVHISIDDFGTGYSSLSYLSRFPAGILKIDRSFIKSVPESAKDSGLVRTIINVGKELGLTTIAEGIEKEDQADFLRNQGCDLGQGYLYHRPMSSNELLKILTSMKV